jgi:hypothetical protein
MIKKCNMKILYYFREEESYMYQWQRMHIFNELEKYGHSISTFNPILYQSVEEANSSFLKELSKNHDYDLFMTCVGDVWIYEDTIFSIKKYGIPTLLICFDNLHVPFVHKRNARYFDLLWLTSSETKYLFEKWGCKNIIIQSYAANPFIFRPKIIETMDNGVAFIGTAYGSRINKLNELLSNKVICNLYSSLTVGENENRRLDIIERWLSIPNKLNNIVPMLGFPIGRKVIYSAFLNKIIKDKGSLIQNDYLNIYPSVSFEEMISIYSSTSLSLNVTELRNTYVLSEPIHKIHLRTFEIPMCGGLQFASYTEELSSYFEEDKEIILYRDKEEFISKAFFYTDKKRNSLVDKMKYAARYRAESQHTWYCRFLNVFKYLHLGN